MRELLSFSSDYMEGAHEEILKRLVETNLEQTAGYGLMNTPRPRGKRYAGRAARRAQRCISSPAGRR